MKGDGRGFMGFVIPRLRDECAIWGGLGMTSLDLVFSH